MGVIENAIEKLRRSGGVAGTGPGGLNQPGGGPSSLRPWAPVPEAPVTVPTKEITLDRARLREAGYLSELGHEARFAEYYREIKRPIIRRALAPQASASQRLILVTSALPGEGKTFTTMNLALSMARERDFSVLLVDADFPKSHMGRALGVYAEPGLLDAVVDPSLDVESMIMRSNVKGLDFLPSGRVNASATELIASARMAEIAVQLIARNPRRLVLFDSAPILAASEARALIHIPGQIILVARAGRTPQHALQEAIAQIDNKKLHGLVLNDAHITKHSSYYYGYAGHADGKDEEVVDTL
jgi:protein-tyrosine kinase